MNGDSLLDPHLDVAKFRFPATYAEALTRLPELMRDLVVQMPWLSPTVRELERLCAAREDPPHNITHIMRVFTWTAVLWMGEKGRADLSIALAAALFHDAVVRRKDDPERDKDNEESAQIAEAFLPTVGFPADKLAEVARIVRNCSYSRGDRILGSSAEALVRDADMLECLGAVGAARFLEGGARMNRPLHLLTPDYFDPARVPVRKESTRDCMIDRGLGVVERLYTASAQAYARELGLAARLEAFIRRVDEEARPAHLVYNVLASRP